MRWRCRTARRSRRAFMGRVPPWLMAVLAIMVAAGAGVGPVLTGLVSGAAWTVVSQAVLVDLENLTEKDLNRALSDGLAVANDEGTHITVAGMLHVGEVLVLDVPLF